MLVCVLGQSQVLYTTTMQENVKKLRKIVKVLFSRLLSYLTITPKTYQTSLLLLYKPTS